MSYIVIFTYFTLSVSFKSPKFLHRNLMEYCKKNKKPEVLQRLKSFNLPVLSKHGVKNSIQRIQFE